MTEQQIIEAMVDAYQGHNPDHMPDGHDWPHEAMQAAYAVACEAVLGEAEMAMALQYSNWVYGPLSPSMVIRAMKGPKP